MILVVDLCHKPGSLSQREFVLPIARIVGTDAVVKHYTQLDPGILGQADKVILCGTALKDNKFAEDIVSFEWLKDFGKPVLGICAGMQVIGAVFGCERIQAKEIGMTHIDVSAPCPLFDEGFEAYELHGHSIAPNNEFEVLAKTEVSVQAIKHKKLPIYGIMFHPEVRNETVVKRFLKIG